MPTGDGCILSGVYKGFRDLRRQNLIERIPGIVAVQTEGSNAIRRAFHRGVFERVSGHTLADSISVDVPRNGLHALAQLKVHNGRVIEVSDRMIVEAQARLSRTTGLFTEPASAAAFAGFLEIKSELPPESVVVVLATGNGLKDRDTAGRGIRIPEGTIRSLDDISRSGPAPIEQEV